MAKICAAEKEVAPQRKVWYDTPRDKQRYRSGHNGADSKFLEAPAISSVENVRRTGLCAGSDFTISYCSCVFFLHSSGAGITLEIYGELSERSKVRHSKCRVPKRNLGFESLTLRHMNETRFSNIFIEKRVSSRLENLERSGLFLFAAFLYLLQNSQNSKLIFLCKVVI